MKKILLITALTIMFTAVSWGAMTDCTQALVDEGVCAKSDNVLLYYQGSKESMAEMTDALSATQKYVSEFECSEATVVAELCEEAEIGLTVQNPMSAQEFSDNVVRSIIKNLIVIHRGNVVGDAAKAEAAAEVDREVEIN